MCYLYSSLSRKVLTIIILQVAARKSREKRLSGIDQLKAEKRAKQRTLKSIIREKEIKARENAIMSKILSELGELRLHRSGFLNPGNLSPRDIKKFQGYAKNSRATQIIV